MVVDFPFDGLQLFAENTDEFLHTLTDSRATLHLLGIYTPTNKRKFRSQMAQSSCDAILSISEAEGTS